MKRLNLHQTLYEATLENHQLVEKTFNFRTAVSKENLCLFHKTILTSRVAFSSILNNLEHQLGIPTANQSLIEHLRNDLSESGEQLEWGDELPICNLPAHDLSTQIGSFYVFAGSSAGAKVILSLAKRQSLPGDFNYLRALAQIATEQKNTLLDLLKHTNLNKNRLVDAANSTFKFIHQIASYEYQG